MITKFLISNNKPFLTDGMTMTTKMVSLDSTKVAVPAVNIGDATLFEVDQLSIPILYRVELTMINPRNNRNMRCGWDSLLVPSSNTNWIKVPYPGNLSSIIADGLFAIIPLDRSNISDLMHSVNPCITTSTMLSISMASATPYQFGVNGIRRVGITYGADTRPDTMYNARKIGW